MDDLFEEEYLRCDECGQYYPKSYLKRCKVCGKIVCGRCRPYHSDKQTRVKQTRVRQEISISDVLSDVRNAARPFINLIIDCFGKLISSGFEYAKVAGIIIILSLAILGACTLGFSFLPDGDGNTDITEIPVVKVTPEPHIVLDETYSGQTYNTLYFEWRGAQYPVSAQIDKSIYMGSKKPESHIFPGGYNAYYVRITTDIQQDAFYDDILDDLKQIRDSQNLDSDEYVELITSFVQSIPYDENAPNDVRYPVTVFFDGKGDCDEKSMLLCGLLAREGYDVVLFDLSNENHMSAAIKAEGTAGYTDGYVYIETTDFWMIGEVPDSDGEKTDTNPEYYKIGDGYKQYLSYDEVEMIIDYREDLDIFLKNWHVNSYNHAEVDQYNRFVNIYNSIWDSNNAGERERLYSLVVNNPLQYVF